MLLHPVLIFFASSTAYTLAAAYTLRDSPLRYATLAFVALCAYIFPSTLTSFTNAAGLVGRVASGAVCWNIVSCLDKLILKRWDYYHYGPVTEPSSSKDGSEKPSGQDSEDAPSHYPGTRMDFGSEVTNNGRGIGLWWQVKNVPLFSETQPTFVPGRGVFLFTQSVLAVCSYYIHNAAIRMLVNLPHAYQSGAYVPLLTRLSGVSLEEIKIRVLCTLGFWAAQYFMMQFFYSLFAILGTVSKPDNINLWPPNFGSIKESYSVRLFWGKFWHQNLRSGVEGLSDFVAHGLLQLPRRGLLQRYTKVISSFAISGAMHVASDTGGGISAAASGALVFFSMQALGIILEDMVQDLYRRVSKRSSGQTATLIERSVGYVWVLSFLIWTSPVWIFPILRNTRLEDALIGFDAFTPLIFGRKL